MTRELKSAKLAPVSIDPRDMVERLTIQADELWKFRWQFADNGPVPDRVLQQAADNSKWLKKDALKKLTTWEGAVGSLEDVTYEERLRELPEHVWRETPEEIFSPARSFSEIAGVVADIAESAMVVEQAHRRMMLVIDPQRPKPTPAEKKIWEQRAMEAQEERLKIRKERYERRRLRDAERFMADPNSNF